MSSIKSDTVMFPLSALSADLALVLLEGVNRLSFWLFLVFILRLVLFTLFWMRGGVWGCLSVGGDGAIFCLEIRFLGAGSGGGGGGGS